MKADAKIFVSGHRGMAGSARVRRLRAGGHNNLSTRAHAETRLPETVMRGWRYSPSLQASVRKAYADYLASR